MALKDWKKRKYLTPYHWQFMKENELGRWDKETSSTLMTLTITVFEPKSIEVLVNSQGGLKVLVRKYFTTKTSAIRYAKEYMTKH